MKRILGLLIFIAGIMASASQLQASEYYFFRCECEAVAADYPAEIGRVYSWGAGYQWCKWTYRADDQKMITASPLMGRAEIRRNANGKILNACIPTIATLADSTYPDFFIWETKTRRFASKNPYAF